MDIKGYPRSTYIPGRRNAGRIEDRYTAVVSRNVVEDIANVELRPTFVGLVDDTGMGQDVIDKLWRGTRSTPALSRKSRTAWAHGWPFLTTTAMCTPPFSKRPDTTPLTGLLQEQGDEIFADCDSIALELDL
ncbi:MAG: hypothetical protein ACLT9S_02025 [Faecalibacterium sp.]